jgi:hypothetical protein
MYIRTGITKQKMDKIIYKAEVIERKLLEVNLRLVHSIAVQHQGMGLELNDLVYEGIHMSISHRGINIDQHSKPRNKCKYSILC